MLDGDSTQKLAEWFEDRWNDRWALDITLELAQIIDESWAGEQGHTPHEIYLKMAYHLSREARAGVGGFRIPKDLARILFPYQTAAVQIAAHHLNKRGGVMLGDVVGLGKTLMATALVRVMQEAQDVRTLIICPVNLVPMWEDYVYQYRSVRQGAAHQPRDLGAARRAALPGGADRREPQPAQPRRQALPRHSGVHRLQREQGGPAVGHALQQELRGPRRAAAPVRAGRRRPGHPPRRC